VKKVSAQKKSRLERRASEAIAEAKKAHERCRELAAEHRALLEQVSGTDRELHRVLDKMKP
jgi:hypothetical protein